MFIIKELLRPTKLKLLLAFLLYYIAGIIKIFSIPKMLVDEAYSVSLFYEYKYQYTNRFTTWYKEEDIYFWTFVFILHLALAYLLSGIIILINNRLRGKDW